MICPICSAEFDRYCPNDDGSWGLDPKAFRFDRPIPRRKIAKEDKPAIMLIENVARHLKVTEDDVRELFTLVPDTNGKSHVLREDYEAFRVAYQQI